MNRRGFLRTSVGVAVSTATASAFCEVGRAVGAADTARLVINAGVELGAIAPEFMGLGYEISSVSVPGLLSPRNDVYVQLVETLGRRGVVRIGGNTADYASYKAEAQPLSLPEGQGGSVLNDAVLRDLGAFLETTGWDLIWALNLGGRDKENAVAEGKAVSKTAGRRLLAFEIGNEPDLFPHAHRKPGYGYDDYLRDYRSYRDTLRKRLPGVPLAGPDAANATNWVSRFASDEGRELKLLTHHYYREGQNPTSSIEKLLHPDPKLAPMLEVLSAASKLSGLPYRVCEVNSFSGGGRPGVSDTFASALWVLDYMFLLAAAGCSGVNIETGLNQRGFVSSYSPIGDDEHGSYRAAPEYYGMLAFAHAGQGILLGSQLHARGRNITAYVTQQRRGHVTMTLINKEPVGDTLVLVEGLPGRKRARVLRLTAPALDAKSGVTFGGASVSVSGEWTAGVSEMVKVQGGPLQILVPSASAAVLTVEM